MLLLGFRVEWGGADGEVMGDPGCREQQERPGAELNPDRGHRLGLRAAAFGIKYCGPSTWKRKLGVDSLLGAGGSEEEPDVWNPGCCRVGGGPAFLFLEASSCREGWGTPKGSVLLSGLGLRRTTKGSVAVAGVNLPSPREPRKTGSDGRCPALTLRLPCPAWHLGQWPLLRQGTILVQPLPGCPLPKLHRLLSRRAAPRGQLPPAENHREGQLCQSQAGPAHPHRPGGE